MRSIPCSIESVTAHTEVYWSLTIAFADVEKAALQFAGVHQGCIPKIVFTDPHSVQTLSIFPNSVTMGSRTVSISKTWLEAIWHLFLDFCLNGWTDAAHIDAEFPDAEGIVNITVEIEPPLSNL